MVSHASNVVAFAGLEVLLAIGGCRPAAPLTSATAASDPLAAAKPEVEPRPDVLVRVEEERASDTWRVRIELATPAVGLRFVAPRNRFRGAKWRPEGGAFWTERDGFEELVVSDPTRIFEFGFDTMTDALPKDYELNLAFSEGSRLLYTGHLAAIPVGDDGPFVDPKKLRWRWQFATSAQRSIRLLDRNGAEELDWDVGTEEAVAGTYVYFGDIPALEHDGFTAIIDPGMPAWLVRSTHDIVPKLFEFFGRDLGVELDFEPLVLLSWGGGNGSGRSSGGGALPGVVQLSAMGAGFTERSPEALVQWQHFVAHEMFHLWNGQRFARRLDREEEWLPEGSAEYFAERALLAAGALGSQSMHRRVVTNANVCITALDDAPLLGHVPPRYAEYYPCGWVLMAYADRVASAAGHTVGTVMAHTFEQAAAREDRTYSTYDFLEAVEVVTNDKRAPAPLSRLLRAGAGLRPEAFFSELIGGVELTEPARATMRPFDFMTRLATQLVRCDCEEPTETRIGRNKISISGHASCRTFSAPTVVTHVGGHGVTNDANEAYGTLLAGIAANKAVNVSIAGSATAKLSCPADRRPSYQRLLRAIEAPGPTGD